MTGDGDEFYLSTYSESFAHQSMLVARRGSSGWNAPTAAPFAGEYSDRSPFVLADGSMVLFASTRPLPGTTAESDEYNLWTVRRGSGEAWSEPVPLAAVNSDGSDYQPSVGDTGTLVFTSNREGSQDIYMAPSTGNGWGEPAPVGPPVNTEGDEMSAFLDRTGRILVFSSSAPREGQIGNDDLYVSRLVDGAWTEPRNLGQPINSFANEYGAFISADGRWLFFTSDRHPPANIYRVPLPDLE